MDIQETKKYGCVASLATTQFNAQKPDRDGYYLFREGYHQRTG